MNIDDVLKECRLQINQIDKSILDLLSERFQIVHKVTNIKSKTFPEGFLYIDPVREFDLINQHILYAVNSNLSSNIIRTIWRSIIANSNLKEQPSLKIYIKNQLSHKLFYKVISYYPIDLSYVYYNNIDELEFKSTDIITINARDITEEMCSLCKKNNLNIYHIEQDDIGEKVCFLGKMFKLYERNDGIFVFFDTLNKNIKFCEAKETSEYKQDNNHILLGSSSKLF